MILLLYFVVTICFPCGGNKKITGIRCGRSQCPTLVTDCCDFQTPLAVGNVTGSPFQCTTPKYLRTIHGCLTT
jgi:hypothetical protein